MKLQHMLELTQELINARGPCGHEEEVRRIVVRELENVCDEVSVDDCRNAVGLIRGAGKSGRKNSAPIIRVMAHMDELSLIVKRVEDNGTLRVQPLGGIYPYVFGLGPVEIIGDERIIPGVLSVGSQHTTAESPASWRSKPHGEGKTLDWPQVYVFTRMSPEQLKEAGVHAGSRVVIAQSSRKLMEIGDCIGGYFLDDRVCLTIMLAAASILKEEKKRPVADVYLVGTCVEEIGGGGALYASRTLPGSVSLAIDVGPVAREYGTQLNDEPIIVYKDLRGLYTKSVCDRMLAVGRELGMDPQCATWESYGSDASMSLVSGQTAAAGLLCIPTENTHGYEIVPRGAIETCARLLAAYLAAPV
ncbi:MAG TPA: peptidase M42 [Planctomycetota bacterium]|nr:peptidase M42 [Planctomycetota bacterium]